MSKWILVLLLSFRFLASQSAFPERRIEGTVIVSDRDPKVTIRLPSSARYAGADRWVLYGIADCELHAFVEADAHKNVQRLYWVQFESYIPTRPDLHHTYDSPRHTQIGGLDFFVDTWVRAKDARTEPGSDREHITALIRSKGFNMPAKMMDVRLVHLLDDQKRKELMIIYGEELKSSGLTVSERENGLLERARSKIAVEQR